MAVGAEHALDVRGCPATVALLPGDSAAPGAGDGQDVLSRDSSPAVSAHTLLHQVPGMSSLIRNRHNLLLALLASVTALLAPSTVLATCALLLAHRGHPSLRHSVPPRNGRSYTCFRKNTTQGRHQASPSAVSWTRTSVSASGATTSRASGIRALPQGTRSPRPAVSSPLDDDSMNYLSTGFPHRRPRPATQDPRFPQDPGKPNSPGQAGAAPECCYFLPCGVTSGFRLVRSGLFRVRRCSAA